MAVLSATKPLYSSPLLNSSRPLQQSTYSQSLEREALGSTTTMTNKEENRGDLLPAFEVLFELLPCRVSFRIILGIGNSFCNNLMAIFLSRLFDALVLSILVGLKDHLRFPATQARPSINPEVEIGVFALVCRPNTWPFLGMLCLLNDFFLRNSREKLFEYFL